MENNIFYFILCFCFLGIVLSGIYEYKNYKRLKNSVKIIKLRKEILDSLGWVNDRGNQIPMIDNILKKYLK